MNKCLLFLPVFLISMQLNAAVHNVEAGGGGFGNPAPYYSPQFLTINVGDTVVWTWDTGTHNVTSTSGPESFSSGDHTAPHVWSFVFNLEGEYDYECTLFDHADTQFGTITVGNPDGVFNQNNTPIFTLFPNPVVDILTIVSQSEGTVELTDLSGRVIGQYQMRGSNLVINKSELPVGIVFVRMRSREASWTETICVQ